MKKIVQILIIFYIFCMYVSQAQEVDITKMRPGAFVDVIIKGDIETAQRYFEAGYDPNKKFLGTPLFLYAVYNKQDDILDLCMKHGADPNYNEGVPPLYYAVTENNKYATAVLLKAGASLEKTFIKTTAKETAFLAKDKSIYNIFLAYESDPANFDPSIYKKTRTQIASNSSENIISASEKKDEQELKANIAYTAQKKDPGIIKISKAKQVSEKQFIQKMEKDKLEYLKYKKALGQEKYHLYVILDKLVRANNLQYKNWRIGLNIDVENINAYATSANLIIIHTSLYDSFCDEPDALAFVVAHELAHLILGHGQIALENSLKIEKLKREALEASQGAAQQSAISTLESAMGDYTGSLISSVSSLAYNLSEALYEAEIDKVYKQERQLEIQADTEAINLMTRAGYNPNKAKDVMVLFKDIPGVYSQRSTHPSEDVRISNIVENIYLSDIQDLKNQGKKQLLCTKPLEMKKSSDKKTIVLTKAQNAQKWEYIPTTMEQKIINRAYEYYLKDDLQKSKELFEKAYILNCFNYIPPLYLSYISEYLYLKDGNKKQLKIARRWMSKARNANKYNIHVSRQEADIKNIYVQIKEQKKQKKQEKS